MAKENITYPKLSWHTDCYQHENATFIHGTSFHVSMCSEEVQNTHAHKHIHGENDQQPFGVIYFKIFSGTHQYMTWYDWLIGYVPGQKLSKYDVWFMIIHPILGMLYAGYLCIAINPYAY